MLLIDRPHPMVADLTERIIAHPDRYALFSDFDGTLAEIAERPEQVVVPPSLAPAMAAVRGMLGGAFAIITGRPLAQVARHVGSAGLEASGLHGLEFSFADAGAGFAVIGEAPAALVGEVVRIVAPEPGFRLEHKGAILAVHYRQVPTAGGWLRAALQDVILRLRLNHHIKDGRAVIEIIPNGTSKGTALVEFMRRTPYAGRVPIMIGDDRADEDAFAVAQAAGGLGLRVAGEHFRAGDEPFRHAGEVRGFIAALAAATEQ
jgi:trehalose 6-phosphate phosphatase